jgi:hypothetical protein
LETARAVGGSLQRCMAEPNNTFTANALRPFRSIDKLARAVVVRDGEDECEVLREFAARE